MITHRTKLLQAIAAGCVCALLFFEGPLAKGDWTSFRNGGASQSTSKLPMRWSATEGIAWQKELIGYGQSCPVILGDGRIRRGQASLPCPQSVVGYFLDQYWKEGYAEATQSR